MLVYATQSSNHANHAIYQLYANSLCAISCFHECFLCTIISRSNICVDWLKMQYHRWPFPATSYVQFLTSYGSSSLRFSGPSMSCAWLARYVQLCFLHHLLSIPWEFSFAFFADLSGSHCQPVLHLEVGEATIPLPSQILSVIARPSHFFRIGVET